MDNSNLEIKTGYYQFFDEESNTTNFYDQYGNLLLGDEVKYSIIGTGGVERNVLGLRGTIVGAGTIQDGYVLVADKNNKYGILKISVKYTATGEVEIIVESEDAGFVADDMEAVELKKHADLTTITDRFESGIRKSGLKKLDMKIYDVSFYDTDGNEKEPEGNVKVTIDIPKDWDLSKIIKVYHMLDDNSVEVMQCEVVDGKVVFYTGSFSKYAVVLAEVGEMLKGDLNFDGQVNLSDAQLILKAALRITTIPEEYKGVADLNNNGTIDLADAQICLKVALKIIVLESL